MAELLWLQQRGNANQDILPQLFDDGNDYHTQLSR